MSCCLNSKHGKQVRLGIAKRLSENRGCFIKCKRAYKYLTIDRHAAAVGVLHVAAADLHANLLLGANHARAAALGGGGSNPCPHHGVQEGHSGALSSRASRSDHGSCHVRQRTTQHKRQLVSS